MTNFVAVGYSESDMIISQNGKIEYYSQKESQGMAAKDWLYTHKLHNGNSDMSINCVGRCPACGSFAIVKLPDGKPE